MNYYNKSRVSFGGSKLKKIFNFKQDIQKQLEEATRKAKEHREGMINGEVVLPENMSFWFPRLNESNGEKDSKLKLPKTMFEHLDNDFITDYLDTEHTLPKDKGKIDVMNQHMKSLVGDFAKGKDLFMKNGIFSNKFNFTDCYVKDRDRMGEQLYSINYTAALFSVPVTTEVVLREFIPTSDKVGRIYNGMPLNTEFRVFYDFDNKKVVGAANYWHPDVMVSGMIMEEDAETYRTEEGRITAEYNKLKEDVCSEVATFMKDVNGLEGKWSVDIMLSDVGELWLIDMARMEISALRDKIEVI